MNFENVTVGEVLLLCFSTVFASQRTARTPPSTFLFLPDEIVKQRGKPKLPETTSPANTPNQGDDNTPGKPCRALNHQTEARKRRNPRGYQKQRRRRWTLYKTHRAGPSTKIIATMQSKTTARSSPSSSGRCRLRSKLTAFGGGWAWMAGKSPARTKRDRLHRRRTGLHIAGSVLFDDPGEICDGEHRTPQGGEEPQPIRP